MQLSPQFNCRRIGVFCHHIHHLPDHRPHQEIVRKAELDCAGLIELCSLLIREADFEGRQVVLELLDRASPSFPGLYLCYPSRRHVPAALRAFIDCLLDRDDASYVPNLR